MIYTLPLTPTCKWTDITYMGQPIADSVAQNLVIISKPLSTQQHSAHGS